jgi:hypothetical protein
VYITTKVFIWMWLYYTWWTSFHKGWYFSSVICPEVLRAIRPLFVTLFCKSQSNRIRSYWYTAIYVKYMQMRSNTFCCLLNSCYVLFWHPFFISVHHLKVCSKKCLLCPPIVGLFCTRTFLVSLNMKQSLVLQWISYILGV